MNEKEFLIFTINKTKKINKKTLNTVIKKFKLSKAKLFSLITFSEKYYEKFDGNKNN